MNDNQSQSAHVVIEGVSIPFGQLVILLVKFAIAVIPAGLILTFLGAVAMGILQGLIQSSG